MTPDDFQNGPITITAYDWVPDFAQGFVRDLRLRWALEEASFPYQVEILAQGTQTGPANLARQPFGQIPTLTVGRQTMFESGACAWRIAEASDELLPRGSAERDACFCWLFGALDSLEEPINTVAFLRLFAEDKEAAQKLEGQALAMLRGRLSRLADALGERSFLVADRFTIADLMVTFVLRSAAAADDLDPFPSLKAYVEQHSARPAFRRALEGQMKPFRENATKYEAAA
jgi:glutathione S-transferase